MDLVRDPEAKDVSVEKKEGVSADTAHHLEEKKDSFSLQGEDQNDAFYLSERTDDDKADSLTNKTVQHPREMKKNVEKSKDDNGAIHLNEEKTDVKRPDDAQKGTVCALGEKNIVLKIERNKQPTESPREQSGEVAVVTTAFQSDNLN